MNVIFSTKSRSSCLFYAVKTYFHLRKEGYHPEFVYTHRHFKVYVWTNRKCITYEFCNGIGPISYFSMLLHFWPIYKGTIIISEVNYEF